MVHTSILREKQELCRNFAVFTGSMTPKQSLLEQSCCPLAPAQTMVCMHLAHFMRAIRQQKFAKPYAGQALFDFNSGIILSTIIFGGLFNLGSSLLSLIEHAPSTIQAWEASVPLPAKTLANHRHVPRQSINAAMLHVSCNRLAHIPGT